MLHIDIETYCELELKDVGVYRYVEHDSFRILIYGYKLNDEEVQVVEQLPQEIIEMLANPNVPKYAFNAQFERVALNKFYRTHNWHCVMSQALAFGLPSSLKDVANAIQTVQKKEGTNLINYFSKPCKPTLINGGRTRNVKENSPEKWELFKEYCKADVEAEYAIHNKIPKLSEQEQETYNLDQKINQTGWLVDISFVNKVIALDEQLSEEAKIKLKQITGLTNPNSLQQLKLWLLSKGLQVESLGAEQLTDLIDNTKGEVKEALLLRQQLSKTSIKKFKKIKDVANNDNKVRGMFKHYGAGKTGRFAGQLVQLQNLKRIAHKDILGERAKVMQGETVDSNTLSQLIRTAFTADGGLTVCDFSAIEARVLAWLAKEQWVIDVFNGDGKLYEATASKMFGVEVKDVTKEQRYKGKCATLACGYCGGVGALKRIGGAGLSDSEMQEIVNMWRGSNPRIVMFWKQVETAFKNTLATGKPTILDKIVFKRGNACMYIVLPSGRRLAYFRPELYPELACYAVDQYTHKFCKVKTYGGKLVENIVQAISRDLLVESMKRIDKAGYKIIGHIHDEIVVEGCHYKEVRELMKECPTWAEGLPLNADGGESEYYIK